MTSNKMFRKKMCFLFERDNKTYVLKKNDEKLLLIAHLLRRSRNKLTQKNKSAERNRPETAFDSTRTAEKLEQHK